jgi:hypothetical protein
VLKALLVSWESQPIEKAAKGKTLGALIFANKIPYD